MSCYAWERGTITLPTGAPAQLRATLGRAADTYIAALTAETTRAWNHLRSLPPARRRLAADNMDDPVLRSLTEPARELLFRYEYRDGAHHQRLRKPTQKAIRESVVGRRKDSAGKTHTIYRCGHDATITLVGNTVTWDVPENNHAPEHAHSHPLATSLFHFLHTVRWTTRSGGMIAGNDEYNRDADYAGGGRNYVVQAFGAATRERNRSRTRQPLVS